MLVFAGLLISTMLAPANAAVWRSAAGGVEYAFDVELSSANHWDPASEPAPALAAKSALALATEFMKDVPIKPGSVWVVQEIGLQRVDNEADQWAYVVAFLPGPKAGAQRRSKSLAPFNVVVALDGHIARLLKKIGAAPRKNEAVVDPAARAVEDRDSQQYYLEGVIYYQKGDYEKARRVWNEAVRLDPGNADAKAGLERIEKITGS